MSVSKLLPAGSAAISELKNGIKQGFATFKWKIGSDQGEFEIFQELLGISGKVKFRLDANAGLHLDLAKKWLRLCEDKPVEFIEQPLAVSEFEQMRYLSKEFKTPIALDESVARLCDLKSTESKGWQGLYVVKPFRLGNLKDFLTWRELGDKKIVYSSALETIFGTDVALKIAATDNNNDFALGFGVSHFFESDGLSLDTSSAEIVVGQDYALEALWQKSSLY